MEVEMQSGNGAVPSALSIDVPPTLSLDALQSILAGCGALITTDQLQNPTASVILQIYAALFTIPTLQDTIAQFNTVKIEGERKSVEMEMQLHDAERLKDEAEKRAEEDRLAKEAAIQERNQMSSQLAELKGTLDGLQSITETGTQQSAQVKGQLEKIQQEKRDLLEMLEREKVESARRAEEIDDLTVRSREARNEASRLMTELQEAKSAEGTAMFKIQSLHQEVTLKANDATWAHEELRKATSELANARNQMHNEITALSSQLQQVTQSLDASQSKVSSLQVAYDSVVIRLEEGTREKLELRQRIVEQEGAFASEMSTQQRLNELMAQAKESAETRMAEVEEQWESILEQHREKEDALRSDILDGKRLREEVEREKQELQLALDRLAESVGIETNGNGFTGGMMSSDDVDVSVRSSTPNRTFMSLSGAPTIMSPTAALASRVQKSGKSFTQVYAELARTQEELRRERLESNRIGGVLEQVMADLQERGPALIAQREECEQMTEDLQEMSTTLAKACEERDACEREAKMRRLQSEASLRENRILNQQVADLGRQVRDLTREVLLRDDPNGAARLEDDGSRVEVGDLDSISDTQMIISTELVTFRSLTDLVTQNARLLRVVRELGTKMEAEEQEYRVKLQQGENEAVAEARELLSRLQDELRTERTRLESIRRERDMFRSMCAGGSVRAQTQAQLSIGGGGGGAGGVESNSAHIALTNQYSQLQSQFDAFRMETAKDIDRLKEEAYQARSEASKNALSAAKEKATCESIEERLTNAKQTHEMVKRELNELQKRFSSLQENLMKQEIASHSLSQEMTTVHGREERLRNEISNLTAEKRLHQHTAERLMEEKKSSTTEKANLSELLRNVQSMQVELERSSGEARRRLESQSEKLEEQCKDLRNRLTREEESHRQTAMRREIETTDLKIKLDKANEELGRTREDLAVARISVEHLSTKSEELQRQVNSKEEKLAVYERRTLGDAQVEATSGSIDKEQQLQVEIADLKGELRGAQTDAEQARSHVEQFKAIAAANEEALSQLQAAYDQYKGLTDASVAEKTVEANLLRERVEAMGTELTSAQQEAGTIRQEMEARTNAWQMEKRTLEDAMTELGGVEDRARLAQSNAQEEVRRQVKLTQEAHTKYEAELVAHAEDVKTLVSVKEELEAARSQIIAATRAMETAQGNLASSTDSWEAQKAIYERENEDVKKVIVELRGQNEALHQHLEALQSQTNEMRQATNADIGDSSFSQSGNEELHDVIKYLRREKKIVDLQVEVREQECARLRQSIEHMQRSLDETRMQLSKEREQNAGASVTAKQHEELMEKINQLSILRESNTTLRDETERSLRKVQSLETQVEVLSSELLPLRDELRVKKVELEASENQLRVSQEDNKRWQGRTQSILQQYNRIDPEDLKKLQEKKEEAEKEVEEQKRLMQIKETELEEARTEVRNKQDQFDRLRAQSIERIKIANEGTRKATMEIEQLRQSIQNTTSQTDIEELHTKVESLQTEKAQLEARIERIEAEKVDLISKVAELEAQSSSAVSGDNEQQGVEAGTSQEAIREAVEEAQKAWDEEKQSMEEKRQAIERREQLHLQRAKEFNTQKKAAEKERDELKVQVAELGQGHVNESKQSREQGGPIAESGADTNDEIISQLRQRIVELESELETANHRIRELEQEAAVSVAGTTPEIATLQEQHQTALKEQESRLSSLFTQQQKSAVVIAVNKAKSAAAAEAAVSGASSQEVEGQIQTAVEAKEKELKAAFDEQLKARYEAGKEESTLRNKLMLKSKDNKIEKLTNELNALKGITTPIPTGPAASSVESGLAPAIIQVAGVQRPIPNRPMAAATAPRPINPPIAPTIASGPARGGPGRTIRPQGNVQKRKLEVAGQSTSPGNATAGTTIVGASNGANEGGGLPKRPRPAGAQINIRGANNRGRGAH